MRLLLVLLGVTLAAAMFFAVYGGVTDFGGEKVTDADFPNNGERLAFLREKGFLAEETCAPEVRQLEYVGFQDHWITFVLSPGESGGACHAAPAAVLPPDGQDSMWDSCSQFEESAGQTRYTCSNS